MSNILEQYPDAIHEVDKNGAGALRYAAERGTDMPIAIWEACKQ